MSNTNVKIWTIGHSNQSFEDFLNLLKQHDIEALVDIRRFPGSRKYPHFSAENLSTSLPEASIEYQWLEGLGGRRGNDQSQSSDNDAWENKSFQNYADYMQTKEFRAAYDELVELAEQGKSAIMCSESVFWRCHRRLVSDYMVASGGAVEHIFPNGSSKPHSLMPEAVVKSRDPVTVIYPGDPRLFD